MVEEVRPGLAGSAGRDLHRGPELGGLGGGRRFGRPRGDRAPGATLVLRRSHQHPVHVGHDRLSQRGHPFPPQHPQQRLLRGRAAGLHRGRPGLPARAVLPLLRDGHGQPGGDHPRVDHRDPGPPVRSGGHPRRRRRRTVHVAVRGAHHVHRRARRGRVRRLRPVVAPDRDHGRVALPGRGHETGHHRDAHGRRRHLLRNDRDLARIHPDTPRGRPRAPHCHRWPGHAARGGQGDRPGHRATVRRWAGPASCAPAATR